jgi:hypothetical protein
MDLLTRRLVAIALCVAFCVAFSAGCGDGRSSPSASGATGSAPSPSATVPSPGATGSGAPSAIPRVDYKSGSFRAEISGGVSRRLNLILTSTEASGGNAAPLLVFGDESTGDRATLSITSDGSSISITGEVNAGGGSGAGGEGCDVQLTRANAAGVAGVFDCRALAAEWNNVSTSGSVDIRGAFEATP